MILHETSTNPDGSIHAVWRSAMPLGNDPVRKFSRLAARVADPQ